MKTRIVMLWKRFLIALSTIVIIFMALGAIILLHSVKIGMKLFRLSGK